MVPCPFMRSRFMNFSMPSLKSRLLSITCSMAVMSLLTACSPSEPAAQASGGPPGSMALPVTVIEVQPQHVPTIIEVVGQAEGSKEVEVRARVSGIVNQRRYTEGDAVKAGTVLFTIDPVPYESALTQARASLAQEKANLERAQREGTRLKSLADEKAISQREYDDAISTLKTSQAQLAASEARVRDAELNLSYTRVTAPITGVTSRALHSQGSLITAGSEASLMTTISATDPIWVRFSLSESETLQLRQTSGKTNVKLVLADGSTYEPSGKLNFSGSSIDAKTGTVPLRAEFPNPKLALLPGQFVRVQVITGGRQAYLVPQSALFQGDQGKLLFTVAQGNTVAPRPVETSGWSGRDWVITQGLNPGDKVITDNLMKLRPGAPVAPHAPGQGPGQGSGAPNSGDAAADKSADKSTDSPTKK